MSRIFELQNEPEQLELLAAQRQLYTCAKTYSNVRLLMALAVGVLGSVLLGVFPESKTTLALFGVVVTLLDQGLLRASEGKCRLNAARVQEEFDVTLFDLKWNSSLCGSKVEPESIHNAAKKLSEKEKSGLKDWYVTDPTPLPAPFDAALCQRMNVVWDKGLKEKCGTILGWLVALGVVLLLGVSAFLGQTTAEFISSVLAVWSSTLISTGRLSIEQHKAASEAQVLKDRIMDFWERGLKAGKGDVSEVRVVQDKIFQSRSSKPPVPDWVHKIHRKGFQEDSAHAAEKLKRRALEQLNIPE